jgi:hypothetical protein
MRIMPKVEVRSNTDEIRNVSNIVDIASDQLAFQKACELIDSYIHEMWRNGPSSDLSEVGEDALLHATDKH